MHEIHAVSVSNLMTYYITEFDSLIHFPAIFSVQ